MPRFTFHAIPLATVKAASTPLADALQTLLDCPREELVFQVPTSHHVLDEALIPGPAFVEVAWFDRGLEVQDQVAHLLSEHLHRAGVAQLDVAFLPLARRGYYEDGRPV